MRSRSHPARAVSWSYSANGSRAAKHNRAESACKLLWRVRQTERQAYAEGNGGKSTKYCPSLPMCLGRHRAVEAIPHDANAIGYALDVIYTRVPLQKPSLPYPTSTGRHSNGPVTDIRIGGSHPTTSHHVPKTDEDERRPYHPHEGIVTDNAVGSVNRPGRRQMRLKHKGDRKRTHMGGGGGEKWPLVHPDNGLRFNARRGYASPPVFVATSLLLFCFVSLQGLLHPSRSSRIVKMALPFIPAPQPQEKKDGICLI